MWQKMIKDTYEKLQYVSSVCNSSFYIAAISQEKQEVELRESIGKHDRSSLKKVETNEKDGLKES